MPILLGLLGAAGVAGWSYAFGQSSTEKNIVSPMAPTSGGLNLTTIAEYVIIAGVIIYFGKKVIKA